MNVFTTDSIKTDQSKLTDIIHNSSIISYFNPQNTVFEEMISSGKVSLIKLTSLRYQVLDYYNFSKKVVTSQTINNELFLKYKDRAIDQNLDMNSLIDSKLPVLWRSEIRPFDNSFFNSDISDPKVEEFARNISLMKATVFINHNWKKNLLKNAEELTTEIDVYLSNSENW
jgi:hypothetical protein